MNKYVFIMIIGLGISSCGLLKENTSETENPTNKNNIITKVNESNVLPNWLSLNTKINIEKEGQNTVVKANIRVKKDSIIWISLKAPLGIEVLRTMISPDSIFFMNRMDKTYFITQSTSLLMVIAISLIFVFLGIFHTKKCKGINDYLTANRNSG